MKRPTFVTHVALAAAFGCLVGCTESPVATTPAESAIESSGGAITFVSLKVPNMH